MGHGGSCVQMCKRNQLTPTHGGYLGISSRLALERYALRDPPPNEEQGTAAAAAYLAHQSSVYGTDLRGNYLVP